MWIREEHGGTRNLFQSGSNEQGEDLRLKGICRPKSQIQVVFSAENRWSPKMKRSSLILRGIFRPKSEIQAVFRAENRWSFLRGIFWPKSEILAFFPAENRWSPKKKKRSSSEKRHEIRSQSTKNINLGLDLHSCSPESVNFFGAQSSLGRAQFSLGGTSSHLEGARPRYAPHGAGSDQNEGIPLKQGRQDSNFNHLRWTDENFRIGKYEEKIKFDKIWGYRNAVSPSNEHAKIQTF